MLIIPAFLLSILSVVVIYTSDPEQAVLQAIFASVGFLLFILLSNFDYRSLKNMIVPFYLLTIIFLVIVFILGIETRGSLRWISIGSFNFQPSEFGKLALILLLAKFWSENLPSWKNIFKSLSFFLPVAFLVFLQPDLGTTLTLCFIWATMLIASNISTVKLVLICILGLTIAPLGWLFMREYQKQRLLSFIYPDQDPLGVGYNVIQSTIAVGSGQILGRGLGRGTQSRLQFLPEFRTDFIFAFIAEELGFIGSLIVLSLYLFIFFTLFHLLSKVGDRFGELIVIGVMNMLFFQIFVNIGMNIGLVPITGITLPLLSYGGSSMVITLLSLAFITSVYKFGLKRKEIDTISF